MNNKVLLLLMLPWFVESSVYGQDSTIYKSHDYSQDKYLIPSIAVSTLLFGSVTYFAYFRNMEPVRFHFYNDFKGFLQVDKFIHSYGSYMATSIWYNGLTLAGIKKEKALVLGGIMGVVPLTPKEVFDGFSNGNGFSWGDFLANAVGPAFFVGQELLFDEQIIKYKSCFSRSCYAEEANGYLGKTLLQSYFKDYNGHSYWLSINVSKIFPKANLPDWISVAAGYSANGMFGLYENIDSYHGVKIPETQRYRQFLISFDVDWSKINVKSKLIKVIFYGFNFIKMPFPALEINSKGNFRGYWIYF